MLDLSFPDAIAARVPHVRHVETVVGDLADDDRGAHAGEADVLGGRLVDLLVGQADADVQSVFQHGQGMVHLVWPGDVLVARAREELADHVGGHLGGDLATGVPAHAVCHEKELLLLDEAEVVLVVVALESLIRLGSVADSHGEQGTVDRRRWHLVNLVQRFLRFCRWLLTGARVLAKVLNKCLSSAGAWPAKRATPASRPSNECQPPAVPARRGPPAARWRSLPARRASSRPRRRWRSRLEIGRAH